jgi:hypothetical protein
MPATNSSAVPSHVFRSSSETTALSNHNFNRLRDTNRLAAAPGPPSSNPRPTFSSAAMATASHLASRGYVEQHRAFVEHQRQLHDEERHLWHLEREELHERIQELERTVRQLGGQVDTSFCVTMGQTHRGSSASGYSSDHQSGMTTNPSTGDEFWRGAGGKSNAHSTRTFSEPAGRTTSAASNSHQLPSISETSDPSQRKKSVGFDMSQTGVIHDFYVHPIPTVIGNQGKGSLDGITFKAAVLAPNGTTSNRSRSPSASPKHGPVPASEALERTPSSESREPKPQLLNLPASGLTASDLLVKDAGHTPLARVTDTESAVSSPATPKPQASEAAPAESEPRPVRLPAEHSDSYFPVVDEAAQLPPIQEDGVQHDEVPDDPALNGPLALSNEPGGKENDGFLTQLDSKLLEAQAQDATDASEASETSSADQPSSKYPAHLNQTHLDELGDEQEEPEPRLKIKRSMNFGSAFGASTVGDAWRH